MKHIISAFSIVLVLLVNILICLAVVTINADISAAKEYKAAVVAEIESSNFNPQVIRYCIEQAADAGYTLDVQCAYYDREADVKMAEIVLHYPYQIPLLGITEMKTTRGIAR